MPGSQPAALRFPSGPWSAGPHPNTLQSCSSQTAHPRKLPETTHHGLKMTLQVDVKSHAIGCHAGSNPDGGPAPDAVLASGFRRRRDTKIPINNTKSVSQRRRARGHSECAPLPPGDSPPRARWGRRRAPGGVCCHREATVLRTSPFTWWPFARTPDCTKGSIRGSLWRDGSQSNLHVQKHSQKLISCNETICGIK